MKSLGDLIQSANLKRHGSWWRGRCPWCGYGDDSLAATNGRDGRALLRCFGACPGGRPPFNGGVEPEAKVSRPEPKGRSSASNVDRARRAWEDGADIRGTLSEAWLVRRGVWEAAITTPVLRHIGSVSHPAGGRSPATLALVQDVAGRAVAVHRHYLAAEGAPTTLVPNKAALGPVWGGAIRLHAHDPACPLVVAEGLITAASASILTGYPCWAAISAGNLATGLRLPPEVRDVVIAADPDQAGRDAAQKAQARWTREGRTVRIATPTGDGDFNDVMLARGANA